MGETNIDALLTILRSRPVKEDETRDWDFVGKESTAEAESPFVLEINGKKAKLLKIYGKYQSEERTLDQWLCKCLDGTILIGQETVAAEDFASLSLVCEVANCIFPVNESDFAAVPLLARLQIVMAMENWVSDLKVGMRYHNDRAQFDDKMREIMSDWTESDAAIKKLADPRILKERFQLFASACQRNHVNYSQLTFTKRLMFDSISDLAMYLLIYFVEHNWMLQRCAHCKKFFRSPSLKRETCSEGCKRAYERRKKRNLPDIEKKYQSAKSNLDRKYYLAKKREGVYVGSDSLKTDFAELLGLDDAAQKRFDLESAIFDDENLGEIREWLKKKRIELKQATRRKQGDGTDVSISNYEEFVHKFRDLLSALRYVTDNLAQSHYEKKRKKK